MFESFFFLSITVNMFQLFLYSESVGLPDFIVYKFGPQMWINCY